MKFRYLLLGIFLSTLYVREENDYTKCAMLCLSIFFYFAVRCGLGILLTVELPSLNTDRQITVIFNNVYLSKHTLIKFK